MINISDEIDTVDRAVGSKKRLVQTAQRKNLRIKYLYVSIILDFFDLYGILFLTVQWR